MQEKWIGADGEVIADFVEIRNNEKVRSQNDDR
jgi:hypothetical protein